MKNKFRTNLVDLALNSYYLASKLIDISNLMIVVAFKKNSILKILEINQIFDCFLKNKCLNKNFILNN